MITTVWIAPTDCIEPFRCSVISLALFFTGRISSQGDFIGPENVILAIQRELAVSLSVDPYS